MYVFCPNKYFGQLLDISPKNLIFFKTFDSEFLYIEVFFTDQNSNNLEIEDKINIALVIDESIIYKNDTLFSSAKKPNICKRLWILAFCLKYGQKY